MNIVLYFLSIYFKIINDPPRNRVEHCPYRLNHSFFIISFGKGIDYHQTYRFDYEEQMFLNQATYSYVISFLHLTIETITSEEFKLTLINLLHYIIGYSLVIESLESSMSFKR